MGPLGWPETVAIFILALLLFGPKKLPELGRTLGKALTEFRRASSDLKATFDRELSGLEREGQSIREVVSAGFEPPSYNYDHGYDSYYNGSNSLPSNETATEVSTVSASATEGAEPKSAKAPEGTVAASAPQQATVSQPTAEPASGPHTAAS
jgi:TatA/E family protein of Tat protein translocase